MFILGSINVQPIDNTKPPKRQKDTELNRPQLPLIIGGLVVGAVLLVYLMVTQTIVQPLLLVIGLLLGYTLFHARFGFTSAFRRMMSVGNGQAVRSHLVMLAVAVTLFAPILAFGYSFLVTVFLVMYHQLASVSSSVHLCLVLECSLAGGALPVHCTQLAVDAQLCS